ncbi:MAG: hypothetical protein GW805_00485 [Ignavibacteria bacterium]|nr:hypothetical protein [Ignavibacteria bacterium]OIO23611.1 MAG: hypothetical protein AUJ54_01265 [Ignavibacteria bacterium CG1_02_37_35]PIS46083.1 MAG: hypothetical protein COT22_01750 [Ignavibacteria bacterium CG08_land_8_20_14_0_20_37_9]PIX92830.1 MAG: hypothetical protein COZ25_13710 [Ignavibacteria bacterium CG_4_10_14_3_um_filter_37_18]PJC61190.1 MAG: hypothetical protein CO025_00240 [Ignavibacteria bacterium CG_4_9_14_0_2_um_filter_37_13]
MSSYLGICPNCSEKNPLFRSVCKNCGRTLRDRLPGLDFWKLFVLLIEDPNQAFTQIIQSEQKNFATFMLFASLFKIYLLTTIISGIFSFAQFSLFNFIMFSAGSLVGIILLGFLFKFVFNKKAFEFRIKDFYAGISYSFMPQLIGLFVIFTMEFIVFGEQIFTFNPSPFLIKKNFAYLFSILESGIIFWNIFLLSKMCFIYTSQKLLSYLFALLFLSLIFCATLFFL